MAGQFDWSRKRIVTHCETLAEKTAFSGVPIVRSPVQERQAQEKPLQFPGGLSQEKRFGRYQGR